MTPSAGLLLATLRNVSFGLDVVEEALKVVSSGDLADAPFPLAGRAAQIHLDAKKHAYLHVLEMCSAESLKTWLAQDLGRAHDEPTLLLKLQEVVQGLEVVEVALKTSTSGDLSQATFPLVADEARLQLEATAGAYLHALEMCNSTSVREVLVACGQHAVGMNEEVPTNATLQAGILTLADGRAIDLNKIQAAINFGFQETGDPEFMEVGTSLSSITGVEQGPSGEFVAAGDDHKANVPTRFATGDWYHIFGIGGVETRCRIVIDLEEEKLVAAQEWTGDKFKDIRGVRLNDLSESVIEVNQLLSSLGEWAPDPEFSNQLPGWAQRDGQSNTDQPEMSIAPGGAADSAGMRERHLVVDGLDEAGCFAGDGVRAPFVVFDVDAQENIAGPFPSREHADIHRGEILAGHSPRLDAHMLSQQMADIEDGSTKASPREDGEVLGLDADGALIQWDGTAGRPYNSGETVDEFGLGKLSEAELKRIGRTAPGRSGSAEVGGRSGVAAVLGALEKLVPHVLHYATMPHAHSDAHRDAADARRVVADLRGAIERDEKAVDLQIASAGGSLIRTAVENYRDLLSSPTSADRDANGGDWADQEMRACDALLHSPLLARSLPSSAEPAGRGPIDECLMPKVAIDSGVDEDSQESGFMNATLQSAGPEVAMSIATSLAVPLEVVSRGQQSIEQYVRSELLAAAGNCEGLSFHLQLGPSREALRELQRDRSERNRG